MLINTQLIQNYLDQTYTAEAIEQAMMHAGLEVEESFDIAETLAEVRIGFVKSIKPLEAAAGMHICEIDLGEAEPVPVLCGSEHEIKEGWGVPVALPGTHLPTRSGAIEATTIHGQASHGMICMDGELGLSLRSTGLHVFEDASIAGTAMIDHIEIDERLLDISVLPNRPDCLGLIGIARELAAVLGCNLVYPEFSSHLEDAGSEEAPVKIDIADADRCSRYIGCVFENMQVGKSPAWLKNALMLLGSRPINNVVDITNFVMFEWGNPLHAFDFATVGGGCINVRHAAAGETMKLLDDSELKLTEDDLVIADESKALALAGVMGGESSQTQADTSRVLLEAAHFEATGIRATRRRHNLSTDSSYRFERGTDPNRMLEGAFQRAATLLTEIAGGKRVGGPVDCVAKQHEPTCLDLPVAKVTSYLGRDFAAEEITGSLERLDMKCDVSDGVVSVEVPTWRVDMDNPVVLIEDVARITSYDAIASKAPTESSSVGGRSELDQLRDKLASFLSTQGFSECRTLPLVDPKSSDFTKPGTATLTVMNPIKEDESTLRRSLLPALVSAVDQNARRTTGRSRFYEIDRTFRVVDGEPREQWEVACILGGPLRDVTWKDRIAAGFHEAKGIAENVLDLIGVSAPSFEHDDLPGMKLGATAKITAGDHVIGYLGEINPKAIKGLNFNEPLFAFQIHLQGPWRTRETAFHALPRHPAIDRDLAFVVDRTVAYHELEQTIYQTILDSSSDAETGEQLMPQDIESVQCFDRYEGKGVADGKISLGIRLIFRSANRTLKTETIDHVITAAVAAVTSKFDAELRK